MNLAVDVEYLKTEAFAAAVLFQRWESRQAEEELVVALSGVADYVPGSFYLRELPCILELLQRIDVSPEHIVIDGYVFLGAEQEPGLGKHLYDSIGGRSAVIGVAKSAFRSPPPGCELLRGASRRPLYITAAGVSTEVAKAHIRSMHGDHRIPTLLKRVDQLARSLSR